MGRLYQSPPGISATQRTANLTLELVDGLDRVPSRSPEARDKWRWQGALRALHRESKGCIGILGWHSLIDINVGVHGSSPGVTVRLAWHLLAYEPEYG